MRRNLFITGGAGFLGRQIIRWAQDKHPEWNVTVFSRDESKHDKARRLFPHVRFVLGDIKDQHSVDMAMSGHNLVIHAAAMKYIPQGEQNVFECLAVNVDGSRNVIRSALRHNVERVIGISTDKAVLPVNVYGMSKALMERMFQEAARLDTTEFTVARYGNVVGSTGSVIPMFRRQAREQGCLTLTDPKMTRFFLSVSEAVDLIDECMTTPSGTILVPRIRSQTLQHTADAAIMMECPDKAITQKVIGLRLGEKIHEELLGRHEIPFTDMRTPHLMLVHPIANGPLKGNPDKQEIERWHLDYSSDVPDEWLSVQDMVTMIKETPE